MASHASIALGERTPEARAPVDEDGGAVANGMERTGSRLTEGAIEVEAPSPVGLLDLPDETVVHIYELLSALLHKPSLYDYVGPPHALPLASVTVNRRIYRLALPVRQQILCIHSGRRRPFRDALDRAPDLAERVRYLELEECTDDCNLADILPLFSSLVTLRFFLPSHMTQSFANTLAGLKNLRNLDIDVFAAPPEWGPASPADPDLSLEDLPALRVLTLRLLCDEGFFLRNGVSNITDLTLTSDGPTSTLSRLRLEASKGYFRSPDDLLNSFWDATEPGKVFAVKHLVLLVKTFDLRIASESEAEEEGGYSYEQTIPELFEILQDRTTSLERLDCVGFACIWGSETELRLPTVKQLVLEQHPRAMYEACGPGGVYGYIELCPSITAFYLAGCSLFSRSTVEAVGAAAAEPLDPSLPSPLQLIRDEPDLSELLETLQETAVTDFRYRVKSDSSVEMRFKRETAAGDVEFHGEWWWM
ncbi:hypothetical protein JCM10213v2_003524 [Rhodosporidiobolus nylandii]